MNLDPHLQRVAWAASMGERLAESIQEWAADNPWEQVATIAPDRLSLELALRVPKPPPVERWGRLFADAVHNLRASQDNRVYAIAIHADHASSRELERVQFPITESSARWKTRLNKGDLGGVLMACRDEILACQPFSLVDNQGRSVTEHPLLILRDLNNRDKHRFQVPGVIVQIGVQHAGAIRFGSAEDLAANVPPNTELFAPNIADGGGLLLRQVTTRRILEVAGRYDLQAQARIELCNGRQEGLTTLLAILVEATDRVVQRVGATAGC